MACYIAILDSLNEWLLKPAHLSSGIELDILPHPGLSCLPNVGLYTLLVRSWFSLLTCFVDRFSVSNLCNLPAVTLHQRNRLLVEPFDSYFCCKGFLSPTMEIEVLGA